MLLVWRHSQSHENNKKVLSTSSERKKIPDLNVFVSHKFSKTCGNEKENKFTIHVCKCSLFWWHFLWFVANAEGVSGDTTGQPDMGQAGNRWGVWLHWKFPSLEAPASQCLRHTGSLHRYEGRKRCWDLYIPANHLSLIWLYIGLTSVLQHCTRDGVPDVSLS